MREACKNLVNNACVHGQPPVTLTVSSEGDKVVLSIQDSGNGMEPGTTLRAGARFVQSDDGGQVGSGIGLAIVHEVIRAHEGELNYSSDPKYGFKVSMILPGDGNATHE